MTASRSTAWASILSHRGASFALSALVFALGASGCLRPTEERVRQDLQVGKSTFGSLSVQVDDGHAAVRELSATRLLLWAAAPRFSARLDWKSEAPEQLSIEVQNCMPRAQLSVDPPRVPVSSAERSSAGVCSFRVGPLGAERALRLLVAPPGTREPSPFRFAVMSDVQEAIPDVQDIYSLINQQPDVDFLFGAGDLTEQGTASQLERFQRELEQLSIPYYTTLGNHELGESPTLYHEYFGRGSQSFEYRGVRFTLLDSASGSLDPVVFDWLDGWLALGAEQPHVVAMHVPPLDPVGVRNGGFANRSEAALLLGRLASKGVDLTIYGHIHSYYHFENAGIPAHVSGGGGAIPERFDDMGRHFLLVDADPLAQRFAVSVVRVD